MPMNSYEQSHYLYTQFLLKSGAREDRQAQDANQQSFSLDFALPCVTMRYIQDPTFLTHM